MATFEALINSFVAQQENQTLQDVLAWHALDLLTPALRARMFRHYADPVIESKCSESRNVRLCARNINTLPLREWTFQDHNM
jgi:hypothetical protein